MWRSVNSADIRAFSKYENFESFEIKASSCNKFGVLGRIDLHG